MTTEEGRTAHGFAERMAYARQKDPADLARHVAVKRRVTALTIGWAIIVPILIVYALTAIAGSAEVLLAAAVLTVLLPFLGAVIATHGRRFGIGGAYVVLTLLMVLPAVWVAQIR
ncbi:hypothetical protein [Actinoplanes solisilvae]|uniref:hypothetical protein n=1 Tax=Actinoplanes solisilvae TaxID=2486853 RepID=UPI000FD9E390|nr:hypothetical protein [Actinoplanes solisilvae]